MTLFHLPKPSVNRCRVWGRNAVCFPWRFSPYKWFFEARFSYEKFFTVRSFLFRNDGNEGLTAFVRVFMNKSRQISDAPWFLTMQQPACKGFDKLLHTISGSRPLFMVIMVSHIPGFVKKNKYRKPKMFFCKYF
jgi:hypothetical protein